MEMTRQHAAVWATLDQLARQRSMSPSGMAKDAGLDSTAFNISKRHDGTRGRFPSMETIALVLDRAGMSFAEFGAMVDAKIGRPS